MNVQMKGSKGSKFRYQKVIAVASVFVALATLVNDLVLLQCNVNIPKQKWNATGDSENQDRSGSPSWLHRKGDYKELSFHNYGSLETEIKQMVGIALGNWKHTGISKELIDAAVLSRDAYGAAQGCFGVLYLQQENRLYTWGRLPNLDPNPHIRQLMLSRRHHVLELLAEVINDKSDPNSDPVNSFEAVFCTGDCVMSHMRFHPLFALYDQGIVLPLDPLPIFSIVRCQSSMNIPFPIWDNQTGLLDTWEEEKEKLAVRAQAEPWDGRYKQAIFRGDSRSCTLYDEVGVRSGGLRYYLPNMDDLEKAAKCGRAALMYQCLTSRRTELFNVSIRSFEWSELRDYDVPIYVSMSDQTKFQYIIYAEGHCQWANRLRYLPFLGAAIIFQDTECIEPYGLLLRPWVHYIPVDYWFSNITAAMEWGEAHPVEVKEMIARMEQYANRHLSKTSTLLYTKALVSEYSRLMQYEPLLRDDAVMVDHTFSQ